MAIVNGQYVNGAGDANNVVTGQYNQGTAQVGPSYTTLSAPDINSFDPNNDPVYLSYLRSLGLSQSQSSDQIARQRQYLNDSLSANRPIWADQRAAAIAGIRDNTAARGVYNSSQRGSLETKANTAVDRTIASAERGNAYQNANLSASYKNNLASNALAQQNQALASRQRQASTALQGQIANAQYGQQMSNINQNYGAIDQNYGSYQ